MSCLLLVAAVVLVLRLSGDGDSVVAVDTSAGDPTGIEASGESEAAEEPVGPDTPPVPDVEGERRDEEILENADVDSLAPPTRSDELVRLEPPGDSFTVESVPDGFVLVSEGSGLRYVGDGYTIENQLYAFEDEQQKSVNIAVHRGVDPREVAGSFDLAVRVESAELAALDVRIVENEDGIGGRSLIIRVTEDSWIWIIGSASARDATLVQFATAIEAAR